MMTYWHDDDDDDDDVDDDDDDGGVDDFGRFTAFFLNANGYMDGHTDRQILL